MTQPRVPREPAQEDVGELRRLPLPKGRRVIRGDFSEMLGRTWGQALTWIVLLAAAGVDVATFYQVLILVMNADDAFVYAAVVGFTTVALALAHYAGIQARDAVMPGSAVGGKITAWACFVVWLLLGLTAFIVRYIVEAADSAASSTIIVDGQVSTIGADSQTTTQHLSALLFLVLYLATGTVAGLAGFKRPNPVARRWARGQRQRSKASSRYAAVQSDLAIARTLQTSIERERQRRQQDWAETEQRCEAAATRLKQEAYLLARSRNAGHRHQGSAAPLKRTAHRSALGERRRKVRWWSRRA